MNKLFICTDSVDLVVVLYHGGCGIVDHDIWGDLRRTLFAIHNSCIVIYTLYVDYLQRAQPAYRVRIE
jgi:hypothetical protein